MNEDEIILLIAQLQRMEEFDMAIRYIYPYSGRRSCQAIGKSRHIAAVHKELFLVDFIQVILQQHLFMISQKANNIPDFFSDFDDGIDNCPGIRTAINVITDKNQSIAILINLNDGHHFIKIINATVNIAYGK